MLAKYKKYNDDVIEYILNRVNATDNNDLIYSEVFDRYKLEIFFPDANAQTMKDIIIQMILIARRAMLENRKTK